MWLGQGRERLRVGLRYWTATGRPSERVIGVVADDDLGEDGLHLLGKAGAGAPQGRRVRGVRPAYLKARSALASSPYMLPEQDGARQPDKISDGYL